MNRFRYKTLNFRILVRFKRSNASQMFRLLLKMLSRCSRCFSEMFRILKLFSLNFKLLIRFPLIVNFAMSKFTENTPGTMLITQVKKIAGSERFLEIVTSHKRFSLLESFEILKKRRFLTDEPSWRLSNFLCIRSPLT